MFTCRISFKFLFWGSRDCDSRGRKTNRQLLSHHRLGEDTEITAQGVKKGSWKEGVRGNLETRMSCNTEKGVLIGSHILSAHQRLNLPLYLLQEGQGVSH